MSLRSSLRGGAARLVRQLVTEESGPCIQVDRQAEACIEREAVRGALLMSMLLPLLLGWIALIRVPRL